MKAGHAGGNGAVEGRALASGAGFALGFDFFGLGIPISGELKSRFGAFYQR